MKLRVIGGEFRGRPLAAPPGRNTRPTRAAVREAWFNAIGPSLPGASVVDLFAGSGALGIEALSRGAARARFVETDAAAVRMIRRNVDALGLGPRSDIRRVDVFRELETTDAGAWDLALADPPYRTGSAERLVGLWQGRPFAGILCVEHGRGELAGFEPDWHRAYRETELSFFIANGESQCLSPRAG